MKAVRIFLLVLMTIIISACSAGVSLKSTIIPTATAVALPTNITGEIEPKEAPRSGHKLTLKGSTGLSIYPDKNIEEILSGELTTLYSWKVDEDNQFILIETDRGEYKIESWWFIPVKEVNGIQDWDGEIWLNNILGPGHYLRNSVLVYPREGEIPAVQVHLWIRDITYPVGRWREAIAIQAFNMTEQDKLIKELWNNSVFKNYSVYDRHTEVAFPWQACLLLQYDFAEVDRVAFKEACGKVIQHEDKPYNIETPWVDDRY